MSKKLEKKQEIKKEEEKQNIKVIPRQGYKLVFVHPDSQEAINEIVNTGMVIGQINITTATVSDKTDEIIFAVRDAL